MVDSTAQSSTPPPVLRRVEAGGIVRLILNRPAQYNALSVALLSALQSQLDDIAADESVRVVLLAAAGKAFCAGHDLGEMSRLPDTDAQRDLFRQCSQVMLSLTRMPQPVIACVQGVATAAGCQLVATCDLAVAAREVRFATSGINVGLFCSTPAVALSRSLARKRALEMLFTGDFIDADTALDWGLVNRVVEAGQLEQSAMELAARIADKSREAVALGKETFYGQISRDVEAAYEMAAEAMACNMELPDAREGIDAFLRKDKAGRK